MRIKEHLIYQYIYFMDKMTNLMKLSSDEYNEFTSHHPYGNFLNSIYAGDKLKMNGWDIQYLGLKQDDILLGAALIAKRSIHVGNYFYIPRGYVIDYDNFDLIDEFTKLIIIYMKQDKGVYFKIDPYVIFQQRDQNGKIKPGCQPNINLVHHMEQIGFQHQGFFVGYNALSQCRWVSVLSLKDKDTDTIFSEFSYQTRQDIRNSERYGVHVRTLNYDELHIMAEMEEKSSKRQHFHPMSLSYYQELFKVYGEHCKALYAYLSIKEYDEILKQQKIETNNIMDVLKQEISVMQNSEKKKKRLKEAEEIYQSILRKEVQLNEIKKTHNDELPLAAAFFIKYGNEVIYLESGSSFEYKRFKATYAIQWHMIKEAIQEGYAYYNFYGISGYFEKDQPGYGVFDFKRGFNAEVVELTGDFLYPLSKTRYFMYQTMKKLFKR